MADRRPPQTGLEAQLRLIRFAIEIRQKMEHQLLIDRQRFKLTMIWAFVVTALCLVGIAVAISYDLGLFR